MVAPLITSLDLPRLDPEDASEAAVDASGLVRGYAGWHIAPTITETVLLEGGGSKYLGLPSLYVVAVGTVTIDGIVETANVTWGHGGRMFWAGNVWPSTFGAVSVTFTHGYPTVPPDVRAVAKGVARRLVANPSLTRQEAVAGYSATYDAVLLGEERHRLSRYRLPGRLG